MKLWHCQIIWYLFAGFKAIILCSVHSRWFVKYVFLLKYDSWKLQLESWNTNHKLLNRTLRCQQTIYQQSHFLELWINVSTRQKEASLRCFYVQHHHHHCRSASSFAVKTAKFISLSITIGLQLWKVMPCSCC